MPTLDDLLAEIEATERSSRRIANDGGPTGNGDLLLECDDVVRIVAALRAVLALAEGNDRVTMREEATRILRGEA